MKGISETSQAIENAIVQLGISAEDARTDNPGQWNISKGDNIQILIDTWEEKDLVFFQILSPVRELLAVDGIEFLKGLLSENHGLSEIGFTLFENTVFLKYTCEAADLPEEKILKLITRMAYYHEALSSKLN